MKYECPNCRVKVRKEVKFCTNCGTEIKACHSCGTYNLINDNYCSNCGANLKGPPTKPGQAALLKTKEEKIDALVNYINSLPYFPIVEPTYPHGHMGATITEAILQAGVKFETVVRPRVQKLKSNYPIAKTTTEFLKLLDDVGFLELINWKEGTRKANSIYGVTRFFVETHIETEEDLKIWFNNESNVRRLQIIKGIKNKTADYFKMLSGHSTVAVDKWIVEFLELAGIKSGSYQEKKEIVIGAADKLGLKANILDFSIWSYMSNKN